MVAPQLVDTKEDPLAWVDTPAEEGIALSLGIDGLMEWIRVLRTRLAAADRVIATSQLCCITTGMQGGAYQTALDEYTARYLRG